MVDSGSVKRRLIGGLYAFEASRNKYRLCSPRTGFFQPFNSFSDLQQQVKTCLVSPVIGLFSIMPNILFIIKSLLIMAIGIVCISPDLFVEGLVDTVAGIEATIVTPIVAAAVTLASLVSMVTRSLATLFSIDGGSFQNELLSFLPANPYEGAQLSL